MDWFAAELNGKKKLELVVENRQEILERRNGSVNERSGAQK